MNTGEPVSWVTVKALQKVFLLFTKPGDYALGSAGHHLENPAAE